MRVDPGIHPRRHLVRADAGFRKVATSCISLKIELRSFCVCLLMRQIRALRYFWPVWQEPSRGTHTGEWANPPDAFIFGQALIFCGEATRKRELQARSRHSPPRQSPQQATLKLRIADIAGVGHFGFQQSCITARTISRSPSVSFGVQSAPPWLPSQVFE